MKTAQCYLSYPMNSSFILIKLILSYMKDKENKCNCTYCVRVYLIMSYQQKRYTCIFSICTLLNIHTQLPWHPQLYTCITLKFNYIRKKHISVAGHTSMQKKVNYLCLFFLKVRKYTSQYFNFMLIRYRCTYYAYIHVYKPYEYLKKVVKIIRCRLTLNKL